MLGPATRQCREIARRQSWFLHSAAPQVVPVVVVRTKRSRLRTRRFAQTAALPSVRTLHAPRAATSVQACRSRQASRPPDSRQPDSFGLATILRVRHSLRSCAPASGHLSMRNPREYANVGGSPCVDCLTACPASYVRLVESDRADLRGEKDVSRKPRRVVLAAPRARKRSSSRAASRRVFVSIP